MVGFLISGDHTVRSCFLIIFIFFRHIDLFSFLFRGSSLHLEGKCRHFRHISFREGIGEIFEKILLLFEERTLAMPRNAEIGTPLFQEKYFTNGDYSPAAVEQEIRKHKIKAVYLRLPQNNPDLLEETLARYPLFRDSLSALTAQGKCRCKTVTRHSQIFYFR